MTAAEATLIEQVCIGKDGGALTVRARIVAHISGPAKSDLSDVSRDLP